MTPQPETVSPWLPIDEFQKAPVFGACWVQIKDIGVTIAHCEKFLNGGVFYAAKSSAYMHDNVTHVMPITKPNPPEVE